MLAPSKRCCDTHHRRHKKLGDWSRRVALQAWHWLPERTIMLVGNSAFAVLDLLAALTRQRMICVTRLRLDAALHEPATPHQPGPKGRRAKSARMPTLTQRVEDPNTAWQSITVSGWYGNTERQLEICSDTAVWHHNGRPLRPGAADAAWHIDALRASTRLVLLRDIAGDFVPQGLLCTDLNRYRHPIIGWFVRPCFVRRWSVEVTVRATRDPLGFKSQRQWSNRTIARATSCLLALFSLVTLLGHASASGPVWPSATRHGTAGSVLLLLKR